MALFKSTPAPTFDERLAAVAATKAAALSVFVAAAADLDAAESAALDIATEASAERDRLLDVMNAALDEAHVAAGKSSALRSLLGL